MQLIHCPLTRGRPHKLTIEHNSERLKACHTDVDVNGVKPYVTKTHSAGVGAGVFVLCRLC